MALVVLIAALAGPAATVTIDWVLIDEPANPPDIATNCLPLGTGATNCGSVDHNYYISKYEVTNSQYAEFLNAVAASEDPYELYYPEMGDNTIWRNHPKRGFRRLRVHSEGRLRGQADRLGSILERAALRKLVD